MLKVVQIANDLAAASGVGTFVRRIDAELRSQGVDSCVVTRVEELAAAASGSAVFHIHGLWLGIHRAAARIARESGTPVVWSTHGMTAPWSLRYKRWKKTPAWFLYQRRDLKDAAAIHCTTEEEVSWNRRLGLAKTFVAPLGTDIVPADGGEAGPRDGARTLLFVGRLHPVKALDRLIAAFRSVPHGGWRLRLVGPDEAGHLDGLKALAGADVEFAGPRYGAELEAEYAACTALALVSHTENFGATVADALAHGKPVVTSTGTPWRTVAETDCGWWVPNDTKDLSEALLQLFGSSPERLSAMGARGRRLVERAYAWPAVTRMLMAKYEELAGAKARRTGGMRWECSNS